VGHVLHADRHRRGHADGAVFVAFSLRVRDLQLSVVIRTRAAYLLVLLVVIVVYSAFVLMPGQSRAAVAAEILFVSVIGVAYLCGWCLPRLVGLAVFSVDLVIRWIAGVTGLLLGIAAGISLLVGSGGGLYFLAFGALLLIANEVASAWSLIVGIGKTPAPRTSRSVNSPRPKGRQPGNWPPRRTDLARCLSSDRVGLTLVAFRLRGGQGRSRRTSQRGLLALVLPRCRGESSRSALDFKRLRFAWLSP
jgi:hypothetical protein